jgi:hypothetical protein
VLGGAPEWLLFDTAPEAGESDDSGGWGGGWPAAVDMADLRSFRSEGVLGWARSLFGSWVVAIERVICDGQVFSLTSLSGVPGADTLTLHPRSNGGSKSRQRFREIMYR